MAKKKKINGQQVEKLAAFGCSMQEIASFFDCHVDTIRDRFSKEIGKGHDAQKRKLRQAQWKSAIDKGNVTMQIWLGKQILKQREPSQLEGGDDGKFSGLATVLAEALVSVAGASRTPSDNQEVSK